jgi:thioredoxin-related protein
MVQASDKAKEEMLSWIRSKGGYKNVEFDDAIKTAYALATKYGEATASLSALMYDSIAEKSGASVPPAEVAPTVSLDEVKKTIYGASSFSQDDEYIAGTVGRMTKQAGADTTLKNAKRDGAEFAWVTSSDSCAYCELLSNFGWQHASAKTIKGDHAEHIHANCQCQFVIRFDHDTTVEGYNPNPNLYNNTPGKTIEEKARNLRRMESNAPLIEYNNETFETYDFLKGWSSKPVAELPVENLKKPLTGEQIISKISGGDMTSGSCSSLSYAYIGNTVGYDVTDFRGGESRTLFSSKMNIDKIDSLVGIEKQTFTLKKEASDLAKILKDLNLEEGKEYKLAAGKHSAIIRKVNGTLEYLELQSAKENGWKPFEYVKTYTFLGEEKQEKYTIQRTLQDRFGCRKTPDKFHGRVYEKTATLTDIESYKNNEEFKKILGLLNTNPESQMKGATGYAK